MILVLHPSLKVQQDAALSLLRLGWAGGKYPGTLREATLRFIELAEQLGTEHVLLDLSALFDLPVYDQLWLSATLLPRALRLKVKQVVVALPDRRVYNRQVMEFIMRQFQAMRQLRGNSPCDVQFFGHAESGLEWLTDFSPRVPELLAEWEQADTGLAEPTRQYAPR